MSNSTSSPFFETSWSFNNSNSLVFPAERQTSLHTQIDCRIILRFQFSTLVVVVSSSSRRALLSQAYSAVDAAQKIVQQLEPYLPSAATTVDTATPVGAPPAGALAPAAAATFPEAGAELVLALAAAAGAEGAEAAAPAPAPAAGATKELALLAGLDLCTTGALFGVI